LAPSSRGTGLRAVDPLSDFEGQLLEEVDVLLADRDRDATRADGGCQSSRAEALAQADSIPFHRSFREGTLLESVAPRRPRHSPRELPSRRSLIHVAVGGVRFIRGTGLETGATKRKTRHGSTDRVSDRTPACCGVSADAEPLSCGQGCM
jgi:hypothetical protein